MEHKLTTREEDRQRITELEDEVERLREQVQQQMEMTKTMRVASHELMVERDDARLLIGDILEEARAIEANCREDWLEEGQGEIEKAAAAADLDFAIVYWERLDGIVRNTKHPEADGLHNNKEN
jgi:TolA-binding protein